MAAVRDQQGKEVNNTGKNYLINMSQGPTTRSIPARTERVCNGCDYLNKQARMRSHKSVTDDYSCTHPDFEKDSILMGTGKGRTIHFNHEGSCTTPGWCPFLKLKTHTDS